MAVLKGFPIVSQLTEITSDGRPSENKVQDCVAASFGAAILYYQGKTQWDHEINPDRLKDAAYGEAWRNDGTAAFKYIPFCKSLGYKLYPIDGNPGHLVTEAHKQLAQGHPVVFTEPDPYVSSALGWSHVCVFYADKPGELTSMDPYIAKSITKSDQEWLNLLLFNQIWIVERIEDVVTIDLNTPGIGGYFTLVNGDQWQCKQTGKIIHGAILAEYCRHGNAALCGLTFLGLPLSNEIPLPGVAEARKQHFERGVLIYDPAHKIDHPPGAGIVYAAQLYNGGPGMDPEYVKLLASPPVADASAQQALQAQLDAAVKLNADLQKKIQVAADALRA